MGFMILFGAFLVGLEDCVEGGWYIDYISNLATMFVGEDFAAEVVVTGKGSPSSRNL